MRSSTTVYKRCRPLLGTFVEVTLVGASPAEAAVGMAAAFQAIAEVALTMSFHEPTSDLSRLNRASVGQWTGVSPSLREVLALALDLQRQSDGAFNAAIGRPLIAWGLLPGHTPDPGWQDLAQPGFEVGDLGARRLAPVQIDLGGIAKGYAVDRAVAAVRTVLGRASGCINAGGDLKVFGQAQPVLIRAGHPDQPMVRTILIKDSAVATSTPRPVSGASAYVDAKHRLPLLSRGTAVTRADDCVVADALTKVALLLSGDRARALAKVYRAEVLVLPCI